MQCTAQLPLCRDNCTLFTVYCSLSTAHCTLYTVHCTQYTVHCPLYTIHYTQHTVHCPLYTVPYSHPSQAALAIFQLSDCVGDGRIGLDRTEMKLYSVKWYTVFVGLIFLLSQIFFLSFGISVADDLGKGTFKKSSSFDYGLSSYYQKEKRRRKKLLKNYYKNYLNLLKQLKRTRKLLVLKSSKYN